MAVAITQVEDMLDIIMSTVSIIDGEVVHAGGMPTRDKVGASLAQA